MVRRQVEDRSLIAETLRKTRERLDLTIEQAAAAAGVPLRYARLLEGERPADVGVSDELYLIPFFRRYAAALGLPAEDLLPDFLGQVQELPPPSAPPFQLRVASRRSRIWRAAAVLLAIGTAAVVILQRGPQRRPIDDEQWSDGDRTVKAEAEAVTAPPPVEPAAMTSPDAVDAAAPADAPAGGTAAAIPAEAAALPAALAPPAPVASPAPAAPPVDGGAARELRIVAAQETWLSLGIDDEPKRNILLQPGEARSWTATRAFTLTVGNAGGITVSLDGRELPPLGRPGQVVRNLRLPQGESPPANG
jgi:cytoskeletal protein RodZ